MMTGSASSAENGEPGPLAPAYTHGPPASPSTLPHRQPPTHWALSSLPSAQPPLRRACARRWQSHVNPALLNRKDWTEQEERDFSIIMKDVLGRKGPKDTIPWSQIAPILGRTPAWSRCPLRAQSSGGAFASQQQPVPAATRRSRGSPACCSGPPRAPSRPERRVLAAWMPESK